MELVNDKDMETMITLHCRNQSGHTKLIQLFAELANVESAEDFIPLSAEHGVQDLCTKVPRASVDKRLTVRDINFNAPPTYENLDLGPYLQIHAVVIQTDADSDNGYDNNGPNYEVENYSDPDLDEVPEDIDDKYVNDDRNVNASSVGNLS
ncbi:hypothetical protein PVK06_028593 [Gossypium arboreum]|uniref:Uncharacterized protein n=1 Tax=Gossypium arboreum TaxID=29729 RepID=A0ABR0P4D9_GOSAR|nr:hypothetical protein PVK06_028593 [Gossypium arboreum]